jgi:hypothetical protein
MELLNVYDGDGRVVGVLPRRDAKSSGQPVGAVNVLVANMRGEVLLQLRPDDKENGGRWDKSVGGHVSAGESFDETAVREAGEELFDDPRSPRILLAERPLVRAATAASLGRNVVFHLAGLHLNVRDVRLGEGGGVRRVLYHVAVYLGRTALEVEEMRPQAEEIAGLRFVPAPEVDELFLQGRLSPNMGLVWLSYGWGLLELAGVPADARLRDR